MPGDDDDGLEMTRPSEALPAGKASKNDLSFETAAAVAAGVPTPGESCKLFHGALTHNPKVTDKLLARSFELVKKFESTDKATDGAGAGGGDGVAHVTFGLLVDRMVRYLKAHVFSHDQATCNSVLHFLHSAVLKERATEGGHGRAKPLGGTGDGGAIYHSKGH